MSWTMTSPPDGGGPPGPGEGVARRGLARLSAHHAARRRLPAARALQAGRPVLIPDYTEQMLQEETEGEYLELARRLRVLSVLVIPVTLSSSLATMTFITTVESARRYGEEDVALAEELVRRAAQIVDNARMHQQLRNTEERFRVALAHSNITLFEQDEELRYRWIYNPPLGFRAADVLGKTNSELVSPEEAARSGRPRSRRPRERRAHPGRGPDLRAGRRDPSSAGHARAPARPLGSRPQASSGPPRTSRTRSERRSSLRGRSCSASR